MSFNRVSSQLSPAYGPAALRLSVGPAALSGHLASDAPLPPGYTPDAYKSEPIPQPAWKPILKISLMAAPIAAGAGIGYAKGGAAGAAIGALAGAAVSVVGLFIAIAG